MLTPSWQFWIPRRNRTRRLFINKCPMEDRRIRGRAAFWKALFNSSYISCFNGDRGIHFNASQRRGNHKSHDHIRRQEYGAISSLIRGAVTQNLDTFLQAYVSFFPPAKPRLIIPGTWRDGINIPPAVKLVTEASAYESARRRRHQNQAVTGLVSLVHLRVFSSTGRRDPRGKQRTGQDFAVLNSTLCKWK